MRDVAGERPDGPSASGMGWLARRTAVLVVAATAVFSCGFVAWHINDVAYDLGATSHVTLIVSITAPDGQDYLIACPFPLTEDGDCYPLRFNQEHSTGAAVHFMKETTKGPALVIEGRGEVMLVFSRSDETPLDEPTVLMSMTEQTGPRSHTAWVFSTVHGIEIYVYMIGAVYQANDLVEPWTEVASFMMETGACDPGWTEAAAAYDQ